jgi:hypothetical protein
LEKRDKERWLHVVCPPFFIATRQRCGGACREELGDLWVAFFLSCFLTIHLRWKYVVKRAFDTEPIQGGSNGA